MKTFKDTEYGDLTGKTHNGDIQVDKDVESLEGSPKDVKGYFYCSGCNNLKNLKGAPEIVEGEFSCSSCNNLKDLKGAPEIVEGYFKCYWCKNLESLEGAPEIVEGDFNCANCENLESVEGAPKKCKKFDCRECSKLKNLDPLLKCDIEEVVADKHLLEDYLKKKKPVEIHGYDKAMEVFEMMNDLR